MTRPRILGRDAGGLPLARSRIISDNGPQSITNDFKGFIFICTMPHVRTSSHYPQSNGKIERRHGSLKHECIWPGAPLSIEDARRLVARFVEHFNTARLHSDIGFVTPQDNLKWRKRRLKNRRRKMIAVRKPLERIDDNV